MVITVDDSKLLGFVKQPPGVVTVLIHGTLVAYLTQNSDIWPMFLFGFAALFVVTQMYGLGLQRWQRWAFIMVYATAVIIVYSSRGWAHLNEIARIPVIEYGAVFVLALLIWLIMRLVGWLRQTADLPLPLQRTGN